MIFKADPKQNGWVRLGAALLAAALLASCGGGTQVERFVPRRLLSFGDEASVMTSTSNKYSINAVVYDTTTNPATPTTQLDCSTNPIWIQMVAGTFGLVFGECSASGAAVTARTFATVGAGVNDVASQITQFTSGDSLSSTDLVTVMAGANDIIALYQQYPGQGASELQAAAAAAGNALGAQIIRLSDLGAKVIVSTAADQGLTPYAAKEDLTNPGRAAFLSALSFQFNAALRLKLEEVKDGGKSVGLVVFDERLQDMVRNYPNYSLVNTNTAACLTTAALPNCTVTTLKKVPESGTLDAAAYTWLWADDLHFSPAAHSQLGSMAASRAVNNPF
ncbi:SGNH/GDSL hydrolase family protein [Rhizobacter sp. SG703]|uniref:SGNH/GDSL hydrolase family protein n=1 Tax=Rhizobacter sp. SG703 TaxID=2587140 RepID=UPI0014458C91|nr:SGNH/GDSL hydrolase family protein [Rhizobacter sp. SG703]NKI97221.1 phospholipase/lecithinase/hemolysin [Rhizobacter sp. SG703]